MKREMFVGCLLVVVLGLACAHAKEGELKLTTLDKDLYMLSGLTVDVNVVFLVTPKGVLLIDSGGNMKEAEIIKKQIATKTDRKVNRIVLTHYHGDHTFGLPSFDKTVRVIGHENCKNNLKGYIKRFEKAGDELEGMRKQLAEMKSKNDPAAAELQKQIDGDQATLEQYNRYGLRYPDITFSKKMTLYYGDEQVEVIHPGHAHTSGNAVVYFPKRKVLVMGDMLFYGYKPYIDNKAGSNTKNWIAYMKDMAGWDVEKVVPGHGSLTDKKALLVQAEYLSDLRKAVAAELKRGATLEKMQKSIKLEKHAKLEWPDLLVSNIEAVHHEMTAGFKGKSK